MIVAICDGACKGNPGPGSYGAVLWERFSLGQGKRVTPTYTWRKDIGHCTNNEAEWEALLSVLEHCSTRGIVYAGQELYVYSDSQLIVRQATGRYKTKDARMQEFKKRYELRLFDFDKYDIKVEVVWIPRQLTYLADKVAR